MINAVRVDHPRGSTWVVDSVSITAYGRFEAVISVTDELSDGDIQRRGMAAMAGRTSPSISVESDPILGDVPGVDYDTGDFVTIGGEEQRVLDISYRLNRDNGNWLPPSPTFSSLWDQRLLDADRALDRLVRAQGGGVVDAAVMSSKSMVESAPLLPLETLSWSSYDDNDSGSRSLLDDNTPWAGKSVQQISRLAGIYYDTDFTGATGNTIIELWQDGAEISPLMRITIPPTTPPIWVYTPVWGYTFMEPGQTFAPRVRQNGQHRQISYHLMVWPAL